MLSIITAAQAASLIRDADTLIVGGNGGTGAAEAILDALEQRFLGGHGPHGLTLINITPICGNNARPITMTNGNSAAKDFIPRRRIGADWIDAFVTAASIRLPRINLPTM